MRRDESLGGLWERGGVSLESPGCCLGASADCVAWATAQGGAGFEQEVSPQAFHRISWSASLEEHRFNKNLGDRKREGEDEYGKHRSVAILTTWPASQAHALTGSPTGDL